VGLDPGLVCAGSVLTAIARLRPQTASDLDAVPDLRRWQREILGDQAILQAIA
jgi:hypothetical protein